MFFNREIFRRSCVGWRKKPTSFVGRDFKFPPRGQSVLRSSGLFPEERRYAVVILCCLFLGEHVPKRLPVDGFRESGYWELLRKSVKIFFKSRPKYRTLYVKTEVRIVVDGDILFHNSIDVQHLVFLYCWQYNLFKKYTDNALLGYIATMVTLRRHNLM